MVEPQKSIRVFKTAWFSKAAKKANIQDDELCKAIQEVMTGQANDLGGGVFKKRLQKNMYRGIVLAKGAKHWVYVYLFGKKDRANIKDSELKTFKQLAELYAKKTETAFRKELENNELVEICHEKTKVQE